PWSLSCAHRHLGKHWVARLHLTTRNGDLRLAGRLCSLIQWTPRPTVLTGQPTYRGLRINGQRHLVIPARVIWRQPARCGVAPITSAQISACSMVRKCDICSKHSSVLGERVARVEGIPSMSCAGEVRWARRGPDCGSKWDWQYLAYYSSLLRRCGLN